MKMKKIYFLLMICISFALSWSCGEDDLDPQSIFGEERVEKNEFDEWLYQNYTLPYNIDLKYRFEYKESDTRYNLVPAQYDKSVALAKLIKHVWIDAYSELMGADFLKSYSPRMFHLVGSKAYNSQGSVVLGTAEGGLKITLYNVNEIDFVNPDIEHLNYWYFKTMHHEFAHILHQTKSYSTDFNLITPSDYQSGSWVNLSAQEAWRLGFVSNYGSSEPQEDFVEIIAVYLTNTEAYWQALLNAAGEEGSERIMRKFEIVKNYLNDSWEIDIEELRAIVERRSSEVVDLDLVSLD